MPAYIEHTITFTGFFNDLPACKNNGTPEEIGVDCDPLKNQPRRLPLCPTNGTPYIPDGNCTFIDFDQQLALPSIPEEPHMPY